MTFIEVNNDVINRIMGITDKTNIGEILQEIVPLKSKAKKATPKKGKDKLLTIYVTQI